MAIEYSLSIDNDSKKIQNFFEVIAKNEGAEVHRSKNHKNQMILNVSFIQQGFNVSVVKSFKRLVYDDFNVNSKTNIIFRFDKFYDDIHLQKKNLLTIVIEILNHISGNCILAFNGEDLLLYRKDNEITINKHFGFWQSKKVKDIIPSGYNEINENKEIDIFPLEN